MKKKNNDNGSNANNSINKSHSGWSNFKLTSLSFIASCSFSGFFVFLGIKELISESVFYTGTIGCALLVLLTAFLFKDFKR